MLMRATSVLAAVSLPVALVSGTASQLDYPACAINHSPQYYCCDLGTPEGSDVSNGLVYVRYNKPQGDGFSSYYDEGWQKSRQINYDPDGDVSLYAPSTPSYVYGEADKTCRLHDVAVNGAVVTTLQCTFAANNDDIYIQNTSLAEDSTDTSVFWSSTPNPRNNNASLPIGAVCRSIMLDDGTVNTTAQSLCTSASSPPVYRFNSFTETPLVVVYAIYAVCFISLACWAGLRTVLGVHQSSDATAPMTSIADGDKKLLDHRGGPETPVFKASATRPSLADRPSEVQLRNSTEDIVQTGYTDSVVGYVVFGYFVLMTVLLNIPIILTIRDNQGKLATDKYAAWFNPTTVVIKVFISLWVIATVWFVVVVVYRFKILNFFRYPTALDKCTRVLMYKPEVTETMLVDRSGVAQMVLKIESFLFPHSRQGVEETVTVHTTTEGTRYLEFQHLRYSFDDVEGKFIPGSVVLPDSYDKILSDSQGLTSDEHARRLDVVGRNAIEVEMPSWATSIVDEFFSFFYIYQLMCYYVWYFTDYVWVSVLNTVVIVLAAAFNIYAKRSMLASVVQMTHYVADVTVKRDGEWSTIQSSDLAPGDLKNTGKLIIFCKGSYEKMASVSSKDSIPANYFETAENLAKNGCYVLGMAYKEMPAMGEADLAAFLGDRDAVEESLALLGLIMFRNEIKEDSRDAILTLKQGDIRPVMITGDNAMTGCYIARASGMVDEDAQMILGDMVADEKTDEMLVWKDVETQQVFSFDVIRDMVEEVDTKVELAVTGKTFDFLVKMGDIQKILLKIRIFSRMTPQGKVDCVKLHMVTGSVTGMCGDGGNDCGALRIAHVGVALSDAEASVVSPFTSKSRTLKSVVDLVLEGRGALATSFASVKYLILYGLIGIGCRTVMYYNGVFISQFGFMYLDGAILVGLSYGLTRARPLAKMGSQRPTSSLVGPTTVCSMVGAAVIHWLFLYGAIHDLTTQPWYCPFQPSNVNLVQWWLLQDSNLGSTLWFIICFQQMSTGLTMGLGSRFRRPIWHNVFLLFWYALLLVVLVVMFVGPPSRFSDQFRVASSTNVVGLPDIPLPVDFRWELFGWGIADTAAVLIFEYFFVLGYVRDYFRAKYHRDALPMKL
ncbi:hypothetical protein C6341_g5196 [Phytophthora cactorum]|nr:hypothetical protein C6341_g5196 [Phytophthora cactorum]